MRRAIWVAVLVAAGVAACGEKESVKAEKELELLRKVGAPGRELCAAERKVAMERLREGAPNAEIDAEIAQQRCLNLEMEGRWNR